MDESKNLKISKDIVARKNQDGTVIVMKLDESSFFFKIDGIAAEVWSKLDKACSVQHLKSEMYAKYPQYIANLERDISDFIKQLLEKKLITEC